jgi:hypothetical protein
MNVGDLQSRVVAPSLGGLDAVAGRTGFASRPLNTVSGNQLIGLDVWRGVGASDRSLHATGTFSSAGSGDIEQMVSHILAPLG